ncbi:MAG: CRISPR-associated ring nuclease Crn3/Csx3 [Candidatus Bathyarchaeota archaeon]|jgi:CRISPR-associated protein Csx3|nr:CRISPR-associated ring nuclease Crn3/Csx3 [Candidatus Bathyarchaeota archaeon]
METIKFKSDEKDEYTTISFELNNAITPAVLSFIAPPKVNSTKGVILSGRGPVWLYGYLVHYYHMTRFIAIYDPRIGGAVVIESHTHGHKIGDVIKMVQT